MQVFPSLNPGRREDVVLLQAWLKDTMSQLTAEFGNQGTANVQVIHVPLNLFGLPFRWCSALRAVLITPNQPHLVRRD